jgi:hypothetical protein
MNRLETDVFPIIGHLLIDAVQTAHIRDIILTIETRGASDVAKRAHSVHRTDIPLCNRA